MEPDGTHVVVFVPVIGATAVLADLEANGQAAIVFARPEDDRACQVKGVFVSAAKAAPTATTTNSIATRIANTFFIKFLL